MTFGKRSELLELGHKQITDHPDRYVHHIYGEEEVGGTSWLYLSPAPFPDVGFPADAPLYPIPELTHGALSVVPMVILLWPAVLGGLYMANRRKDQLAAARQEHAVQEAVADAVARTEAAGEQQLERAMKKAKQEQDKAVAKAREEGQQAADEESEGS
jgi:hypothetical protein